jgi:phenylpropionate dioxygenase-like ring-hydroxylating dioxygenase large terminal subunit
MVAIDHWHPLISSRELKRKPVAVRLHGRELVLFRTASGAVGAFDDICPHRRSRLSTGTVMGERLRCQYHAWTFDACGNGESPGTPKLTACATSYDTRETLNYVWVKPRISTAVFPAFDLDGYTRIGELRHRLPGPLELVVDNFTEIEHTTINHTTFGHDLKHIAEVTVRTEATDDVASVFTSGPTKRLAFIKRLWLGAWTGYHFQSHAHTFFSPVHTRFDHFWTSPDGTREGMVKWRLYLFYTPVDDGTTDVISFMYAKSRWWRQELGWWAIAPIYLHETDIEIARDYALLAGIADKNPSIGGMKLSRFDKILGLTRERIERIYRGNSEGRKSLV